MAKKKTYIAYGSNMDFGQMQGRCPEAEFLGAGMLKDWRLMFKGSLTGSYATIEKEKGCVTPVLLWKVSATDEERLDRYEGFPTFYYKKTVTVESVAAVNASWAPKSKRCKGMAYIMHEERGLGLPSGLYYDVLARAYRLFGFDMAILEEALAFSTPKWPDEVRAREENAK
ncbi:MAG: gamma-glutamylcyclotransferase [Schwartzia sp.]|nr:gamma-glutamylcyclotransferase [Schwartzia sp. (in: firmicutes)]